MVNQLLINGKTLNLVIVKCTISFPSFTISPIWQELLKPIIFFRYLFAKAHYSSLNLSHYSSHSNLNPR